MWIAVAVVTLVMTQHQVGCTGEIPDPRQYLEPDGGMLPHDLPFRFVEFARLQQDVVRDPYLPYVVQEGSLADDDALLLGEPRFLREEAGVGHHPLGVGADFLFPGVQRPDQGHQRVLVGKVDLSHDRPDHLGLLAHLLFEVRLVLLVLHDEPALFQRVLHGEEHPVQVERLGYVVLGAVVDAGEGGIHVVHRRNHENGRVRRGLLDVLQQVDPRPPRHHDVQKRQVELLVLDDLKPLFCARGLEAGEPFL